MAFQHKPGFGALFRNDRREKDSHPHHKGTIMDPAGKVWEIAAWEREGSRGAFLSLKLSEPRERPVADTTRATAAPQQPDLDDDIPF